MAATVWVLKENPTMKYLETTDEKNVILLTPVADRPISWLVEEMEAVETLRASEKAA